MNTNIPAWALYIHWPFCASKCPYCDFNSHVLSSIPFERFKNALLKELETLTKRISPKPSLQSIFFGGGTPSLMQPETVAVLIEQAKSYFLTDAQLEITLEANPSSFDQKKFRSFKHAGVNRLSLGVQSFDDTTLKLLGRKHNAQEAESAIQACADLFPSFSFDLMYGIPNQTIESWQQQLNKALAFKPKHLSCYQLTFEKGTAFYTRFQRGELQYPNEDQAIIFDNVTEKTLEDKNLHRYEVSNYADFGHESRHNLAYWQAYPTLGIGPGSHGRPLLNGKTYAEENLRAPLTWLESVEKTGSGVKKLQTLSSYDRLKEWLLMGLRLKNGVPLTDAERVTGKTAQAWLKENHFQKKVHDLFKADLLNINLEKGHLYATKKGRLKLNGILEYLF